VDIRPDTFWKAVDGELKEGHRLVGKLETFAFNRRGKTSAEEDFDDEILSTVIGRLHQRILLACDVLNLQAFLVHFNLGWGRFKRPTSLSYMGWVGVLYCPALEYLADSFEALSAVLPRADGAAVSFDRIGLLEQVLRGTPKLIHDRGLHPSRELEISDAVYSMLIHMFPDTVREVPIAQVSKAYKPDIGVRSLKAAIEYKFADSERKSRLVLGQIYEDIHGYAGSADWTNFFAVIYMTGAFLTQAQVDAERQLTDVPHSWKPILVTGMGSRTSPEGLPAKRRRPRRAVDRKKL
jgi:REase_DpnII-MboI